MDARDTEVRCTHCDAGFARGTRFCIHCQQPLGSHPRPIPGEIAEEGAAPELAETSFLGRVGPVVVAVLFAILSVVSRMCSGDPGR